MKRSVRKYLRMAAVCAAIACGVATPLHAAAPVWEYVAQAGADASASDASAMLDVASRSGYIYVTVTRPVPVRVINILGQTVASQTLQRGTSRLRVPARGVYIVRAENFTRHVTV